jgi:aryl-alcohol dehydrogenase-like predicted oxidoreductase
MMAIFLRAAARHWPDFDWVKERARNEEKLAVTRKLSEVADDLGVTMAQMSIAWLLKNPNVSTVITGASKVSQVEREYESCRYQRENYPMM